MAASMAAMAAARATVTGAAALSMSASAARGAVRIAKRAALAALLRSFDLDLYAYTPQLVTAQFSTFVSLTVSLLVISE